MKFIAVKISAKRSVLAARQFPKLGGTEHNWVAVTKPISHEKCEEAARVLSLSDETRLEQVIADEDLADN